MRLSVLPPDSALCAGRAHRNLVNCGLIDTSTRVSPFPLTTPGFGERFPYVDFNLRIYKQMSAPYLPTAPTTRTEARTMTQGETESMNANVPQLWDVSK